MKNESLIEIVFRHDKGEFALVLKYLIPEKPKFEISDLFPPEYYGFCIECNQVEYDERLVIIDWVVHGWILLTFDKNKQLTEYRLHKKNSGRFVYKLALEKTAFIMLISESLMANKPVFSIRSFAKRKYEPNKIIPYTDLLKNTDIVEEEKVLKPFPYLIIKMMTAMYIKVPVQLDSTQKEVVDSNGLLLNLTVVEDEHLDFLKSSEDLLLLKLKESLRELLDMWGVKRGCIVLGENRALYFDDGVFTESMNIPAGGILIYRGEKRSVPDLGKHY